MSRITILFLALFIIGCGPKKVESKKTEKPPAKPSSIDVFVDGATGKTYLETKQKKEVELRKINADYNKKLEDALGE